MPPKTLTTADGGRIGTSRVARDFFAARYALVVARTFDAPMARVRDEDVAFVVGALSFLGRREDAQTCFQSWRERSSAPHPRTVAASRFFLGLALARGGQFELAREKLVGDVRARLREADGWSQAFVLQGLAAYRYFTGRYQAAARHALRALRAAHGAGLAYVKLLANDLRGHALVQVGRVSAGMALLAQAKELAQQLGSSSNAFAIDCSRAVYALRFGFEPALLEQLEQLLGHPSHDSYSRHALLVEYAAQLALRGRGRDARQALERADSEALQRDVRRAKLSNLLSHLHVTRFSHGADGCAELLQQADAWLDDADVAFRSELLGLQAFVARSRGESTRLAGALLGLRELAATHDLHSARSLLQQFSDDPYLVPAFAEDRRTPLLRAVAHRDEASLPRLLSAGLLGAVPELLGATPGRRIWVLVAEDALLLEELGEARLKRHPPGWCAQLLTLLASGDVSKPALVAGLWGLRQYRPERHDTLIRTTVHRLRSFIEPFGAWVKVTPNGYGTSVPVVFVGGGLPAQAAPVEPEEWGAAPLPEPRESATPPAPGEDPVESSALRLLSSRGAASVREVGKALGVSQSTALRLLRELVESGRVRRTGFARATRYELARAR